MRKIKTKRIIKGLAVFLVGVAIFSSSEKILKADASSGLITYENINYQKSYKSMLDFQAGRGVIYHSASSNRTATRDEIELYLNPNNFLQFIPGIYTHSKNGNSYNLKMIKISDNGTNIYKEAISSSQKISTVNKGQIFVVLDQKNNWYKINRNGIFGWVREADIQFTNGAPRDMYQFIPLSEQSGITEAQLNSELKGKGILEGMGKSYLDAARKYSVNEIYLLGHSLLETGHGTSKLATGVLVEEVDGKKVTPHVTYNMFGIRATDGNAIKNGSEYAYKMEWFTPEAAIEGGIKWIAGDYIYNAYNQNTIYKMRWNPIATWKQYATDVAWGYKQTRFMDIFEEVVERNNIHLKFEIPTYTDFYNHTQWKLFGGEWYLLDRQGLAMLGWQELSNNWYYMANSGIMQTDSQKLNTNWYYFNAKGQMQTGWMNDSNDWYYLASEGSMQIGWLKEGSTWYYLATDGLMQTGWHSLNNDWYYFNTTGGMQTGWVNINNARYYLAADGSMQVGWLNEEGNSYYLDAKGEMQTGWHNLNNKWYYFDSKGEMQVGWTKFNDTWYYMSGDGVMRTGWLEDNGEWYYLAADGSILTGWQELNNKWYYFSDAGVMLKNTIIDGHRLDSEGVVIGEWEYSNGNWYFYEKDIKVTGWIEVENEWYYLNKDGVMATGWLEIGSSTYYLQKDGAMASNWQRLDGNWYFFNANGNMQKNTTIDGHRLNQDGVVIGDWKKVDGNWYFFEKDTKVTGWIEVDNKLYYLDSKGIMLTDWQYIDNNWYYFNAGGAMVTGWVKVEGDWYYLNTEGEMQTGWLELGAVWYYLTSNGSMVTGEQYINNNRYYFDASGIWLEQ